MLDGSPQDYQPRSRVPLVNAPKVVLVLIGLCIAVHLTRTLGGEEWDIWSLRNFSFIPAQTAGIYSENLPLQRYWTALTYAFLHGDGIHLTFNSLWLLIFGAIVARYLSTARFLLLCALATMGGAMAFYLVHRDEVIPMIGASGAVSGLVAAAVPLMYGAKGVLGRAGQGNREALSFPDVFRLRNPLLFMVIWLAITLLTGTGGLEQGVYGVPGGPQVAWEAHLGGFVMGLIAFYLLDRRP
jgi:membrane associated rhomboid family serine protease